MSAPRIALLAPGLDLLDWAAGQIIDAQREQLPDFSTVTLLVPGGALIEPLRRQLLRRAGGALLGPQLLTLSAYAAAEARSAAPAALDCKLRLAQALGRHLQLFGQHDALALAEDFYALFEALAANAPELAGDAPAFAARVARGYGADLGPLSEEAQWVHTLWRAWLEDCGGRSPASAEAQNLAAALIRHQGPLYLIGFDQFSAVQAAALRPALARDSVHLWLQGPLEGRDGAALRRLCAQLRVEPARIGAPASWCEPLFSAERGLAERLPALRLPPGLRVQAARDPEHEARLADVAIRRWLLAGKDDIVVVSQDRRYARRLRALLERAGVRLRDEAGWALSTSSAAGALMQWLDCVDQGFAFRPLLGLLKSGFMDPGAQRRHQVEALERAIYDSGIAGGAQRLAALGEDAAALLAPLQQAAAHLVLHGGPRPAQEWSTGLQRSLAALPLMAGLARDRAGASLLQRLRELDSSLARSALKLSWTEFRALLRRLLEQASFAPEAGKAGSSPVRLLTLEQLGPVRCQALVLAGAAAGAFPGGSPAASLFNQGVRAELGLPHWSQQQELALARFRQLLEAAPDCLISYAPQSEGEEALPCAWVELLLCAGAHGDPELEQLAGSRAAEIAQREPHSLRPAPAPRPRAVADLLPQSLSASAHQALVDCPYRFYASACLGLRAPQEPDRPYSRQDFGERVHAVLARFTGPVVESARAATEQRMLEAARAEFAPDLRSRALARAWLAEFEALVPDIVGWLIERSGNWPEARAEERLEITGAGLRLHGRVDRLEKNRAGAFAVVDYKTGAAPARAELEAGEQVQATHYALLLEGCERVEYLRLKRDAFAATVLEGEALAAARDGVRWRAERLLAALESGAPLPAQGDTRSCERCDYAGLCRKGSWPDA